MLQVSFRKRAINYRALLQEMIYKDKANLVILQPIVFGVSFLKYQNSIDYLVLYVFFCHVLFSKETKQNEIGE